MTEQAKFNIFSFQFAMMQAVSKTEMEDIKCRQSKLPNLSSGIKT